MRLTRISMAGLTGTIALIAVGLACLMFASSPWAGAVFSITLGFLSLAPLGIIYRRGERRAFWIGAALCGWSYMIFSSGPWFVDHVQHRLVTTKLLRWAYPWLISEDRRSSNPRFMGKSFDIESAVLQDGLTISELNHPRVDVWTKGEGEPGPSLLMEDIQAMPVLELGGRGGGTIKTSLMADAVQFARLEGAKVEGRVFFLRLHKAGALDVLWSAGSVSPYQLENVAHPLFGLLCAWIGGLAGRTFFATHGTSAMEPAGGA